MSNIAVIGCGGRSRDLLSQFNGLEEVTILGAWDPIEANARLLLQRCRPVAGKIYSSFYELVNDGQVDWAFVASPNVFHKEHIIAAFRAGKHVFSEKPLATSIADCVAINQEHQNSGKLFAMGFTLRYASIYRKAKEILDSGRLGKIISINACENITPDHGYYIMHNWRRMYDLAGPHILEKCVHDLDLLNWFCGSLPVKLAAFGGNNMFVPENQELYHKNREVFELTDKTIEIDRFDEAESNSFIVEKDIEDNIVAIMEYANSIRVQFQATTSNPLPERRMYFCCTNGNLILELYSGQLIYRILGQEETRYIDHTGGGHGDGDHYIMKELLDSMLNGTKPLCGGKEGLLSTVVGISIDRARKEGQVLDLAPIWQDLGVELAL